MDKFIFSLSPLKEHNVKQYLFDSSLWQNNLNQAFGSQALYGKHIKSQVPFTITIFRAGIFKIGYLGFPVGNALLSAETITALQNASYPSPIHILRFSPSAFNESTRDKSMMALNLTMTNAPETAVTNLQEWDITRIPKLKRDINKANRSNINILEAHSQTHAKHSYQLYAATIRRHAGNLRYPLSYFEGLIELSQNSEQVQCLLAEKKNEIIGFIVFAEHEKTAYYLHGSFDPTFRSDGVSDRLIYEAICRSQQRGITCFNMMASPEEQPTLVKFKEKWGGTTQQQKTYTIEVSNFYSTLFKCAFSVYNLGNKLLRQLGRKI